MTTARQGAAELLEGLHRPGSAGRKLDLALLALILANVAAVVLSTVPAVSGHWRAELAAFEVVSVGVFTVEYLLRLWSCVDLERYAGLSPARARLRWMCSPLGVVDLLAVLPFYVLLFVPVSSQSALLLRLFRGLRLLRAFKLVRYSVALDVLRSVLRQEAHSLAVVALLLLVALVFSAWALYVFEYPVQPEHFSSMPAAMWWAVVTLTTVGYGDIVPVTAAGKLLAGLIAVTGVAIAALPAGILASGFAAEMRRREHSFHRALEQALVDGRISAQDVRDLEKVREALGLSEAEAVSLRLDALSELRHLMTCPHCGKSLRP